MQGDNLRVTSEEESVNDPGGDAEREVGGLCLGLGGEARSV